MRRLRRKRPTIFEIKEGITPIFNGDVINYPFVYINEMKGSLGFKLFIQLRVATETKA